MKVTVKGFLHWRKYAWEETPDFVILSHKIESDPDYVYIGDHELEAEIPDDFDPIPGKIEVLRKEKQRIQAEAHVKAENIEAQIQELLCIEDKSVRCPECKSENCHPSHGFTACGIETSYKSCDDCGHQWGHE